MRSLSYSSHPFKPEQLILLALRKCIMPTISISTHEDSNNRFMVQPTARTESGLPLRPVSHGTLEIGLDPPCQARGFFFKGPSRGSNSNRLLTSIFAESKTETLIYQCFCFAKTAKKCHFWQFIAPFGSQLRQIAF